MRFQRMQGACHGRQLIRPAMLIQAKSLPLGRGMAMDAARGSHSPRPSTTSSQTPSLEKITGQRSAGIPIIVSVGRMAA